MPSPPPSNAAFLQAARHFLVASNATATEQAFAPVVQASTPMPLSSLDALEKQVRHELGQHAQQTRTWWRPRTRTQRHLTWLDLCNADGYVRERTLRCLQAAPSALFLALALRRLNDWVPEVRTAAREHLPRIAAASAPQDVTQALWAVLPTLDSWGRFGAAERKTLEELTASESVSRGLLERILDAPAGPVTSILVQVTRTPLIDTWLKTVAHNAIQPAVRARSFRFLMEGRATWVAGRTWTWTDLKWCKGKFEPVTGERRLEVTYPLQELLEAALRDASPSVRCIAAEILIRQPATVGTQAAVLAATLASDRSPHLAARGRFAMARLSEAGAST